MIHSFWPLVSVIFFLLVTTQTTRQSLKFGAENQLAEKNRELHLESQFPLHHDDPVKLLTPHQHHNNLPVDFTLRFSPPVSGIVLEVLHSSAPSKVNH